MKKTLAILLTIILITMTFASCNLDGSAGIFRQLSQAKEPLSIRYKQLLGKDATHLYFTTVDGIERVTSPANKTTVVANKYENIVRSAALASTGDIVYRTNNVAEQAENKIKVLDTTDTLGTIPVTSADTSDSLTDLSIEGLYSNSMILVYGKDSGVGKFELLKFDGAKFSPLTPPITLSPPSGYGVHAVVQQTGKEQDANVEMILSFAKDKESYLHYLVDPKGVFAPISLGTKTTPIANFMYPAANVLYVLTTDGNLYHIDTTDPLTWNKIGSTSNTYKENAFAFAVDEGTSKYHFITKPTLKSAPLVVFTIPYTTSSSATHTQIQSGYAKELSLTNIVSAMDISTVAGTSRLLVATYENGMFEITINNANADVDDASNGSTTGAEEYTFL